LRYLRLGEPGWERPVAFDGERYADRSGVTADIDGAFLTRGGVRDLAGLPVVGPFDDILLPRGSTRTDWEAEPSVVIGRRARYLDSPDQALDHVAGYAISKDVSERRFQLAESGGQWSKGKSRLGRQRNVVA
jgi:hypothetical protein